MRVLAPPPLRQSLQAEQGYPAAWLQWFADLSHLVSVMSGSGPSSQRPAPPPFIGYQYFDTTLGKPIWAKTASQWVDATGAPVP
jgi:hypothetical protein